MQTALQDLLAGYAGQVQHALVLGAGPGRSAWDLCHWLPRVSAVDLSYTMVSFFYRLLEGPFLSIAFLAGNRTL